MATSQFTIYKNVDVGAPQLYGATGSLLNVLNKCLVEGYTNKSASGWLKPIPDISSSYGMFKQVSGSQCSYFLNDNGPNATGTFKEARLTGWEIITSIESGSGINVVVTGSGQFPTFAQLAIGSGSITVRKSATVDNSNNRPWVIFADASTCYVFVLTGDVATTYFSFMMGDVYSFYTGSDPYKAGIIGRQTENSAAASIENLGISTLLTTIRAGQFMARTYTGAVGAITISEQIDGGKTPDPLILAGSVQYPNAPDYGIYLSPVYISEGTSGTIRGVMRGFWFLCHVVGSFTDGQIISGSGDFAGKNFTIMKLIGASNAICAMETSNTIYTN